MGRATRRGADRRHRSHQAARERGARRRARGRVQGRGARARSRHAVGRQQRRRAGVRRAKAHRVQGLVSAGVRVRRPDARLRRAPLHGARRDGRDRRRRGRRMDHRLPARVRGQRRRPRRAEAARDATRGRSRGSARSARSRRATASTRSTPWVSTDSCCSRTRRSASSVCTRRRAIAACRRYNDYVIDWTQRADDRARAVCQINMTDHDSALAELQRVVDLGARGVLLPCAEPPAGNVARGAGVGRLLAPARGVGHAGVPAHRRRRARERRGRRSDVPVASVGRRADAARDVPRPPGRRGAHRPLLHRGRAPRGRGVHHVPGDGRRVRALPAPAVRRDRVRRRLARPAVRAPRPARHAAPKGRCAVPAAAERVHPAQRARSRRSGQSPSTCSSIATGSRSHWCSAPTTRTSKGAVPRSRCSRR